MSPIVNIIEIDCPPDEVYSVATDPARFAEWQKDVVTAGMEGGARPGPGARLITTRRFGGMERTMTQEITEFQPPVRWAARGVDGPIRPTATVEVEPLDGGTRSRVIFGLDFDGHGVGVPLVPAVRRQARKGAPVSHRNLKNLLEAGHRR